MLYAVAYDEAVRALSEQQAVIDSFRARAGLLLSAAAIATSFLGAKALEYRRTTWIAWLALGTFVGAAAVSLAILWPRRWELAASPRDVIETYIDGGEESRVGELHRDLSLYMHHSYVENRNGLERLSVLLQIASGLVAAEVVIWIAAVASTL